MPRRSPVPSQACAASNWNRDGRQPGTVRSSDRQEIADTCEMAGLTLGNWDQQVLEWLVGLEPSTVAVIVGLVTRAWRQRPPGEDIAAGRHG